jgi:hypothetical protein
MTATTNARDHLAELTELKTATAHMFIETRYAASIQQANVRAANARAEFVPFTNDCRIKADDPTTGTKPCK